MKLKPPTLLMLSLALGLTPALHAQAPATTPAAAAPTANAPAPFSQGELEAMVAPIALYPDALLSQLLMASTYPLEIVEAARWRKSNPNLKDKALEDALQKQSWDASVKSLAAFPDVLSRMNEDLAWTQKLGDAFLGQQKQLLDAVQSLRHKAQAAGNLNSNEQQTVKTETQESKQVIVIEPANPQVVYVPTYQPTYVYGGWPYPAYPPYYPPYWYPPVATPLASGFFWGVGLAAGAALWGNIGWGHGDVDIDINRYNNFNRTNISNKNWQHDGNRRGAVPYRDQGSRDKYAGSRDRQAAQARDQFRGRDDGLGGQGLQDRQGLQQAQRDRAGSADRGSAGSRDLGGDRGGAQAGTRDLGGDRGGDRGAAQAGSRDSGGDRGGAGAGQRASPAQADRGSAFAGGSGASTRAASDRGHSSMGSGGSARSAPAARPSGGGGMRGGGGGGRGGGGRR
jgi:hypothetical protein